MDLSNFRMLIHEFLNKYLYILIEESPLNILDIKSDICITQDGKDTNHTWHIAIRVHLVKNGEKCKIQKIHWCERDLQLEDIATKNVG